MSHPVSGQPERLSVRLVNARDVFTALLKADPERSVSPEWIARRATVARGTVARLLDDLRDAEKRRASEQLEPIVFFSNPEKVENQAERVSLNPAGGYIGAIEWGHRRITVAVADAFGRVTSPHDWRTVGHPGVHGDPRDAIDTGIELLDNIIGPTRRRRMMGVGLAVAAPVDPFSRRIRSLRDEDADSIARMGWVGIDPAHELEHRLAAWRCKFTLANDSNLAAWDDYLAVRPFWAHEPPLMNAVHLKWGTGVGAGIVVHGRRYVGPQGLAGEIGHQRLQVLMSQDMPASDCSSCGRRDCLENVISYNRLRASLGCGPDTPRGEIDSDPRAKKMIGRFARYLGTAIAGPIAMFNPQAIALAGPAPTPENTEFVLDNFRRGLEDSSPPATYGSVKEIYIRPSRWRDVDDEGGRLAVISGAIHRSQEYAHEYLFRELLGISIG
jgi:predicted NBD/HSP70 family sugar kinase